MQPRLENKIRTNSQRHDHTGRIFGRLTVLTYSHSEKRRGPIWKCKCECGQDCFVAAAELRAGDTRSCGCIQRNQLVTHGLSRTPEHKAWTAIKERCYNPNCKSYYRYGGRGIRMCERWLNSFEVFYKDVGPRPSAKHSIDRINTFGDYEPGNVRWATIVEQQNNTRKTIFLEFGGQCRSISQWAETLGMKHETLATRIERGWTVERALRQAVGNYRFHDRPKIG